MDEEIEYPHRPEDECDWREPGQIVAMMIPDSPYAPQANARPYCAIWAQHGPDMDFSDGTATHETFHLFGFGHNPSKDDRREPEQRGVDMSLRLTGGYLSPTDLELPSRMWMLSGASFRIGDPSLWAELLVEHVAVAGPR